MTGLEIALQDASPSLFPCFAFQVNVGRMPFPRTIVRGHNSPRSRHSALLSVLRRKPGCVTLVLIPLKKGHMRAFPALDGMRAEAWNSLEEFT